MLVPVLVCHPLAGSPGVELDTCTAMAGHRLGCRFEAA